jgi:hypothetical protein
MAYEEERKYSTKLESFWIVLCWDDKEGTMWGNEKSGSKL